MHFRHISSELVARISRGHRSEDVGIAAGFGLVAATSSRNEGPVRRRSLLDAAAATNSDPGLCVVIEQFYREQRSRIGVDLRTLKHTNLVISDTREWNS